MVNGIQATTISHSGSERPGGAAGLAAASRRKTSTASLAGG